MKKSKLKKKSKRNISTKRTDTYSNSHSNYLSSNQFRNNIIQASELKKSLINNHEYLLNLLLSLDGVIQSPKYHPESDALFHTLQVFELAYKESIDPELWLAALFHDVGKSVDSKRHAEIGAEMLLDVLPNRIVWLIEHHLDLMTSPRKTQQRLANTQRLNDLVKLRAWDIAGRCVNASVCSPYKALNRIVTALTE